MLGGWLGEGDCDCDCGLRVDVYSLHIICLYWWFSLCLFLSAYSCN